MGIYDRPYYSDGKEAFSWQPPKNWSAINLLLAINVLVFVADMLYIPAKGSPTLTSMLALYDADLFQPMHWIRFLTYGFTHSSIRTSVLHILLNMFVLWTFGRHVEQQLGRTRFLVMYLFSVVVCGLLTVLWHLLWRNQFDPGMVGASGAVSTVVIYFVFLAPNSMVNVFFVPMPAWVMGTGLVLMDFVRSWGGNDGIAHETHLIGAALGAAFYQFGVPGWNGVGELQKWWRKRKLRVVRAEESREEKLAAQADKILDKVNRTGVDSLSPKERKILDQWSRRLRSKND